MQHRWTQTNAEKAVGKEPPTFLQTYSPLFFFSVHEMFAIGGNVTIKTIRSEMLRRWAQQTNREKAAGKEPPPPRKLSLTTLNKALQVN